MRATRLGWILLLVAAVAAQEDSLETSGGLQALSGAEEAAAPPDAPSRRQFPRFSRLRGGGAARRRGRRPAAADEPETAPQFEPQPRDGAGVAPADVAADQQPAVPRRRSRLPGSRRGGSRRRRPSRVRVASRPSTTSEDALTIPPAARAAADQTAEEISVAPVPTPAGGRSRQLPSPGRQQLQQPSTTPVTSRQTEETRTAGRRGSKFDLQAFLREKNRLPTADVSSAVLAASSAPASAPVSAPVSAPAPVDTRRTPPSRRVSTSGRGRSSAPATTAPLSPPAGVTPSTRRPSDRRGSRFNLKQFTGGRRRVSRRRQQASRAQIAVPKTPGVQSAPLPEPEVARPVAEEVVSAEEPLTRRPAGAGSRARGFGGRRGRRPAQKRLRVASDAAPVAPEVIAAEPKVSAEPASAATPKMEIPTFLAAFLDPALAPYGASEVSSPLSGNGIADDAVRRQSVQLADEFTGGREGRSYLPLPGSRSRPQYLPEPSGKTERNSYLPETKPSPRRRPSYLPEPAALPARQRSSKPSYLPEPSGAAPPRPSLFDGLSLPPPAESQPKPQSAAAAAECHADPGAIRLEVRFLQPCSADADCPANLACFTAAMPCPGAEPQDSVCLPAMAAGAACSRNAHCSSAYCQDNVCL